MELKKGNCYNVALKGKGENLIFVTKIDYIRTVTGKNSLSLSYTEVWGMCGGGMFLEDIDYMYEVPITDKILNRLRNKYTFYSYLDDIKEEYNKIKDIKDIREE